LTEFEFIPFLFPLNFSTFQNLFSTHLSLENEN